MAYNELDSISETTDVIEWRRLISAVVRDTSATVRQLVKEKPPWWAPIALGVIITMVAGYIGLVHSGMMSNRAAIAHLERAMKGEMAEENRRLWAEVHRVGGIQNQRTSLVSDIEDLKRRLVASEAFAHRVPFIEQQMKDISGKLDRIIERQWPRGGALERPGLVPEER